MKKLWNPNNKERQPVPSNPLYARFFLTSSFLFALSFQAMATSPNPEDSLVVIYDGFSSTGFCLGVVTGEKEVTTSVPCAKHGGFGNYTIYRSPQELSYWEGFNQHDWQSGRSPKKNIDEKQIVTIILEEHPENKSIAKVSKQATPIWWTPLWKCLAMTGDWNDVHWQWQKRWLKPNITRQSYILSLNNHLPASLRHWYFNNTVAIFDQDGALAGFSYCPEAAYSTSSDKFRVYSVDYRSGIIKKYQELYR